MPRYLNTSTTEVREITTEEFNRDLIRPGEEKNTAVYYNVPYLTLVSHEPFIPVSGASKSARVDVDSINGVLLTTNGYEMIQFMCSAPCSVQPNENDIGDLQIIPEGTLTTIKNTNNQFNTLRIRSLSGTPTLTYIISRFTVGGKG